MAPEKLVQFLSEGEVLSDDDIKRDPWSFMHDVSDLCDVSFTTEQRIAYIVSRLSTVFDVHVAVR